MVIQRVTWKWKEPQVRNYIQNLVNGATHGGIFLPWGWGLLRCGAYLIWVLDKALPEVVVHNPKRRISRKERKKERKKEASVKSTTPILHPLNKVGDFVKESHQTPSLPPIHD